MAKLVIVESPAKARTIANYLGRDYRVLATMGHLRDLPRSTKGVDIANDFAISYQPIEGKEEKIEELRTAAEGSDAVFLATDPDREGEAISWHLQQLLSLPEGEALRVTFNEITQREVQSSIQNPRKIDIDLVDAQQARRVLDRIVGYEISPLLWRKIRSGLSAGRVQSVATRLVVDRENEIRAFKPDEYWSIEAVLDRVKGAGRLTTQYFAPVGAKKTELKSEAEAEAVMAAVREALFTVSSVSHSDKSRAPAPPFTTSTLQQDASRKLGMNPRRTMSIAQQLYEGVKIEGHGSTGLITYMRTDSVRIADEALDAARSLIRARYGADYLPGKPITYKARKAAQDAHEAVRPAHVELIPDDIKASLTSDQYKVYKLIWSRFIACQMKSAIYDTLTIDTVSAGHVFRANHTTLKYAGFTAVYEEGRDDEEEVGAALPDLQEGEPMKLAGLTPGQHFTKPPARYTEASLIRAMEEKGIGRPSTYAPTISTILDREYVRREGKQLIATPLGEVVTGFMTDKFTDIVDVEFTARMESALDEVEEGNRDWKAMLRGFYEGFAVNLRAATEDLSTGRLRIPDEASDLTCELCGQKMVIKYGRFGRYMACSGYPECKNTKPVSEETPGVCPTCGGRILKKKSRNGYTYYGCEKNPACGFMTWDVPQSDKCASCGRGLFKKSMRGAKKAFCINEACPDFLPEDQRGYPKKTKEGGAEEGAETKATSRAKTAGKATKTAAKRKTTTATKTAASKTASSKAATKTTASKTKTPVAKTTASKTKTATGKSAASKATSKTAAKPKTASRKTEAEKA